jgi:hypothetical protein
MLYLRVRVTVKLYVDLCLSVLVLHVNPFFFSVSIAEDNFKSNAQSQFTVFESQ